MQIGALKGGPYAGWQRWRGQHEGRFADLIGPYFFRRTADGRVKCSKPTGMRDANGFGFLHGGFLMAFIDHVMFAIARPQLGSGGAVTLTCYTEFLSGGRPDQALDRTGEIVHEAGRMLFVRGLLSQEERPVCACSGTLRKVLA